MQPVFVVIGVLRAVNERYCEEKFLLFCFKEEFPTFFLENLALNDVTLIFSV